ncbi:MAG TPA: amidohydrolase family protein [Puia sp.]|nr:amidohydrolase family protein [Puia sp.]
MRLSNLTTISGESQIDILIEEEKIQSISPLSFPGREAGIKNSIDFGGALVFPGLINSHDHIDFNLFPPIANRIYNNYREWGKDIHQNNRDTIDPILKIPQQLRIEWGIYKNLLNGITTVVNHGEKINPVNNLISVFQDCYPLHSVQFEKFWEFKINKPRNHRLPFVIHLGEGTDDLSKKEIGKLIRWNILKKEIIAVHGVAMNKNQAKHFKALVWCPVSNYFFLNATAKIDELNKNIPVIFGTDSTLTAGWNLWEHLRLARKLKMLTDMELFESITGTAASVWDLKHIGKIRAGQQADLVVAKTKKQLQSLDAFYDLNPEDVLLVLHRGNIRLFDDSLYRQLKESGLEPKNFSRIYLDGMCKWIQGDIISLIQEIRKLNVDINIPISF